MRPPSKPWRAVPRGEYRAGPPTVDPLRSGRGPRAPNQGFWSDAGRRRLALPRASSGCSGALISREQALTFVPCCPANRAPDDSLIRPSIRDNASALGLRRYEIRATEQVDATKPCGVAPIPASSGMTTRHRLNRGGHRQTNAALCRAVIVRMQHHEPTKAYVARRTAEGKTKAEIIRCLKRLLAREPWAAMRPLRQPQLAVPNAA